MNWFSFYFAWMRRRLSKYTSYGFLFVYMHLFCAQTTNDVKDQSQMWWWKLCWLPFKVSYYHLRSKLNMETIRLITSFSNFWWFRQNKMSNLLSNRRFCSSHLMISSERKKSRWSVDIFFLFLDIPQCSGNSRSSDWISKSDWIFEWIWESYS